MPYRSPWSSVERAKRTIMLPTQACRHAVDEYPGGATGIAGAHGSMSPSTLNHKLSLTGANPKHRLNIDELGLIMELTRDPRIVDALLHPIGFVGIDVSDLREGETAEALLESLGSMLNREGELITHLTKSLADNHVNCDELDEFELLTERLAQAVFKLLFVVRQKHREGKANG